MIATSLLLLGAAGETSPELRVDPLLLAEVVETYDLIASDGSPGWRNPVWPGWDARSTPVLLYLPGVQDALLNHPSPPPGFVAVRSELLPPGWTLFLRDGETTISLDGQNTSRDVGGVETLVVADPISNLRPNLVQILRGEGDEHDKEAALTADLLSTDPYDQLGFVVHEAFHVHQFREAPDKAASEAWLFSYPWLDAENLAGFAVEGRLFERALTADGPEEVYLAALRLLAVRLARRAHLSAEAVRYEDGTEFSEGLAKYTEWALLGALEGRTPGPAMRWARGFHGYADLSDRRARLLRELRANLDGEVAVNGDPYGAGGLRFRLYYSGLGLAALLDALEAEDWHARILAPGTTLTELLRETLLPTDAELAEALEEARAEHGWDALLAEKRAFEERGWADADARAAAIEAARPLLLLDYSAVPDAAVGWSFTPFGITRLADGRVIYGQIPLSASLGSHGSLRQEVAAPALHDAAGRTIRVRLRAPAEVTAGTLEDAELALPGVVLTLRHAEVEPLDGGGVRVRLLP